MKRLRLNIQYGSHRVMGETVVQFFWPDIYRIGFYQLSLIDMENDPDLKYAVAIWRIKRSK